MDIRLLPIVFWCEILHPRPHRSPSGTLRPAGFAGLGGVGGKAVWKKKVDLFIGFLIVFFWLLKVFLAVFRVF